MANYSFNIRFSASMAPDWISKSPPICSFWWAEGMVFCPLMVKEQINIGSFMQIKNEWIIWLSASCTVLYIFQNRKKKKWKSTNKSFKKRYRSFCIDMTLCRVDRYIWLGRNKKKSTDQLIGPNVRMNKWSEMKGKLSLIIRLLFTDTYRLIFPSFIEYVQTYK